MTNEEILKRFDQLEMDRKPVEGHWEDIGRFILPVGGGMFFAQRLIEGEKNWSTREVWDSTAPIGAQRLASFLWSSLVGTFRWFDVMFPVPGVNKDPTARKWLDDTGDRMYDALSSSNFALEFASLLLDEVSYGNGFLTQEPINPEKWAGFEFAGAPLQESYFEEDWQGHVLRYYRKLTWTPSKIISKFTNEKTGEVKVPDSLKERAKQANAPKEEVVFCIYRRDGKKAMDFGEKTRAPLERPYGFKYILRKGADTLGDEGGYYEMPAYAGRWERAIGSQWGFGPGLLALPTVKLLNTLQEEIVNAAAKVVDPVTLVSERALLGDPDMRPGGLVVIRGDPMKDMVPFESKARFDVSEGLLERHQMMVRKFFREDDIGLKESPAMTATEVMQRVTLMNRLFGGPVARIQNDIFDPTLQTTFSTMYREGQIDPPPQVLIDAVQKTGMGLKIQYRGPFSRAMRDDEVAAIERLFAACAGAMKMGFEDVKDDFNASQALREMAERLATPAAIWNSPQQAAAAKQQRAQLQQAMMQAQVQKTAGEARRAHSTAAMNEQDAAGGGAAPAGGMLWRTRTS